MGSNARATTLCRVFCLTAGPFLLIEDGIFGTLLANTAYTVGDDLPRETWNVFFQFNGWHHLLHVVTGAMLLVAGLRRRWAPLGTFAFGAIYALITPFGWLDGNDIFNVIYSSPRENVVHTLLAIVPMWLGVAGGAFSACRSSPRSGPGRMPTAAPRHPSPGATPPRPT